MDSVTVIADEYWPLLKRRDPYCAVVAGGEIDVIEPVDEGTVALQSAEARALLDRLSAVVIPAEDEDLAAVLEMLLRRHAGWVDQMWHIHPAAPYQSRLLPTVAKGIAHRPEGERAHLVPQFAARLRSIAGLVREQRARGIVLPREALAESRSTWLALRSELSTSLFDEAVAQACTDVLAEIEASKTVAGEAVGVHSLPGGDEIYRAFVRQEMTLDTDPDDLHQLGLEQCAELSDQMAELRSKLGGPADDVEARSWVAAQPHLYAESPDAVAALYRRHMRHAEPGIAELFRVFPQAPYDVRRADPAVESALAFGYYRIPTPSDPVGLYLFNGSGLGSRSQLTAAALILHELVPGHHFHLARQNENADLHPVQRYAIGLTAFEEGWAEYASGLGWELGSYEDDWDAYGRLCHERYTATRLVVDTALNLGRWNLPRAHAFMRANTLDDDGQIALEALRYATDLPAQALAYRGGYLAFQEARESSLGGDILDVHEAMVGGGAVPLTRMRQRVDQVASPV
ncbi:DUF885 domain-containing protein [Marmoricola sp. RAF53]|uniref:DUF885 domain-containing protein n=1 Tax=Marmoricola sp. RAF53 TaxID=3233059 RepID=UPI003F9A23E4